MEAQLTPPPNANAVVIGCVSTAQENAQRTSQAPHLELLVSVDGQPKTCRGFVSDQDHLHHILCNIDRFSATSPAEQYRLIHHEFAGLAGVEQNNGAASDYRISTQIAPESILRMTERRPSIGSAGRASGSFGGVIQSDRGVVRVEIAALGRDGQRSSAETWVGVQLGGSGGSTADFLVVNGQCGPRSAFCSSLSQAGFNILIPSGTTIMTFGASASCVSMKIWNLGSDRSPFSRVLCGRSHLTFMVTQ